MELINKNIILLLCVMSLAFSVGCSSNKEINPEVKGRFVFDRDGNKVREYRLCVTVKGKVKEIKKGGGYARWSPDGEKFLTLSGNIFDKAGNFQRKIESKYFSSNAVWYTDGKSIVISGYIEKDDKLSWYIVHDYIEDEKEEILYKAENKTYSFRIFELEVSPDGQRVIFTAGEAQGDSYIYIINIDGTELKQLYEAGVIVSWYPDSKHIYFQTNTDLDGNMINNDWGRAYKMDVDTEELETVEETVKYPYRGTRVSRDGKYLVYSKPGKEGGSQIMICPVGQRTEDKEIPVTYPKFRNGHYTEDTNPDWYQG